MPDFGKVVGRFITFIGDGPDANQTPDPIALTGNITFSLNAARVSEINAAPPLIIASTPIRGVLDTDGDLSTPNAAGVASYKGLWLAATNDPDLNPQGLQYIVTYDLFYNNTPVAIPPHSIVVLANATVDLALVAPVEAAPPLGESAAAALLALAVRSVNGVTPDSAGDVAVSVLPAGTNGQVLKHNGTTWAAGTDNNTTYPALTQANVEDVASTITGLATGQRIRQALSATGNAATETLRGAIEIATTAETTTGTDTTRAVTPAGVKAATDALAAVARTGAYADLIGTVPTAALPPLAINEVFTVASQAAMLALTAQRGDMAIRSDTTPVSTWVLASDSPATLADWKQVQAAGQVLSVAGKTGTVTLAKADVGLGSVDNTADSAKPVSTAQATAIGLKLDSAAAPELIRDTIGATLIAGANITITPNDGADTITITSTGGGGGSYAGDGLLFIGGTVAPTVGVGVKYMQVRNDGTVFIEDGS